MCAHRECADRLLALGLSDVLARAAGGGDATEQRYAARVESKLGQHLQRQRDAAAQRAAAGAGER